MSIGEVLAEVQPDFPEITISKIRFLESAGLLEPQRTPSGYRQFGPRDIARLRYVLAAQRDHYLPLRVIRDHLDAIDRGLEPPALGVPTPQVPAGLAATADGDGWATGDGSDAGVARVRLSRAELAEAAGLTPDGLAELGPFGLLAPVDGGYFDEDALTVARTVAALRQYGLHPRHLRPVKAAADREVDLIEQVISPLRAHRSADSLSRAEEVAEELATLSVRLHDALVKSGLTTAVPSAQQS